MKSLIEELKNEHEHCKFEISEIQRNRAKLEEREKCFRDREALLFHLIEMAEKECRHADMVTEMCQYCGHEANVEWDVQTDGHAICCPNCGERLMLCSECPEADACDWSEENGCKWDDRKGTDEDDH